MFCRKVKELVEPAENANDDIEQQGEKNKSGNREIKTKIITFDANVARQPAYPMKLIMKKINNYTRDNYQDTDEDNVPARFMVHDTKVTLILNMLQIPLAVHQHK